MFQVSQLTDLHQDDIAMIVTEIEIQTGIEIRIVRETHVPDGIVHEVALLMKVMFACKKNSSFIYESSLLSCSLTSVKVFCRIAIFH